MATCFALYQTIFRPIFSSRRQIGGHTLWGRRRRIHYERLQMRVHISIEAPLENLVGGSLTGDSEGQKKDVFGNGASISMGALIVELGGRSPLLGNPKDI
jgi:hypothetical protein